MGLPGETKKDFYNSMQKVVDFGFQRAAVADIRLLDGSVMAEEDYKKKFGIESLFRVIPAAYGEYGGIKVVEYEECIRKTNTMTKKDFIELRLFVAHYYLLFYLELGKPLIDFAEKNGVRTINLISDISKDVDGEKYPTLHNYFEQFHKKTNGEWYKTNMEADEYYLKDEVFNKLMKDGFPKLNFEYASKLITDQDLKSEFISFLAYHIKNKLTSKNLQIDEISNFCIKRLYQPPFVNKKDTIYLSFDSAKHLAFYLKDYEFVRKSNKEKKGEYRGLIESSISSDKNKEKINLKSNHILSRNKKNRLEFDTDKKKSLWLKNEMKKYDGEKNILRAIQLVLQVNQKAFLRSYSIF